MTSQPEPVIPLPPTPPVEPPSTFDTIKRIVIIASAVLIGFILVLFIIAVVIALTSNVEQSSAVIRTIRDLVIIFLALEGILIVLSLAVLIIQVARLINLFQTELKPILENTQETIKTAAGTVEFVGRAVTDPLVKTGAFLAAVNVFAGNLFGIRRAVRHVRGKSRD